MDWQNYLMGFAQHAATKSKDSTQVGAVLVAQNGRTVLLTAYNGPPAGVADLPERRERPAKYLFASHAEANLIAFAAREGIRTQGGTVYVTHHPCSACARALIQAGVTAVVYGPGQTSMPEDEFTAAATMFSEAGVSAYRYAVKTLGEGGSRHD
ncbi:deoxycytidylate deaminase [Methylobacterium komagatae]